eukprot:s1744_g8.t1
MQLQMLHAQVINRATRYNWRPNGVCISHGPRFSTIPSFPSIGSSWIRLSALVTSLTLREWRRVRLASSEARNVALQEELLKHGISFEDLDRPPHDPLLYPALRCCKAFVSPPTSHAQSVASRPGRAAAVARDVHRLVQDARAFRAAWRERKSRYQFDAAKPPLTLVIDCVRSTQNVASLLRSCAVAGVEVVYCGITPAPPTPSVMKYAGDAALVPSRVETSAQHAVKRLQQQGFEVWALETTDQAKDLDTLLAARDISKLPLALVVGHERRSASRTRSTLLLLEALQFWRLPSSDVAKRLHSRQRPKPVGKQERVRASLDFWSLMTSSLIPILNDQGRIFIELQRLFLETDPTSLRRSVA